MLINDNRVLRMVKKKAGSFFCFWLSMALVLLFMLLPIYWTVCTSLKNDVDIIRPPVKYLPIPATLENFSYAWTNGKFSLFFANTMIVSVITAAIVMVLSVFVGYGLSRFVFRGRRMMMLMFLATQLIPGVMLLIPLFLMFNQLHLIDTLTSLVILFITFDLPFSSLLIINFIKNVPYSVEEAAMVDGCSRVGIIFRIVMPMLVPGMIAIATLSFINSWNEFLLPLIMMTDTEKFTISIGLGYMKGAYVVKYGAMAAGSVIAMLPVLLLFVFLQRYLVSGLSMGAVKE